MSTGSSSRTEATMTMPCRCSSPRSAAARTRGLIAALLPTMPPLTKRQTRGGRCASPGWPAARSGRATFGKGYGWRERLGEFWWYHSSFVVRSKTKKDGGYFVKLTNGTYILLNVEMWWASAFFAFSLKEKIIKKKKGTIFLLVVVFPRI